MRRKVLVGMLIICTAILLLSETGSIACAGDWPMFHHDLRHTGYTDEKIPDDLKLIWSYKTRDRVVPSSPAVADGKIFVGSWDGKIYCFGEKKGSRERYTGI